MTGDPADRGLSRDRILRELDGSLDRLGAERVDMYLTHEPDEETPIAETLRRASTRWFGPGRQERSARATSTARASSRRSRRATGLGLTRFGWVQNEYSLLRRGVEEDVLPICEREGLGFTPFSPLAGGWLTGKYRRGEAYPSGSRMTLRPDPYDDLANDATFDGLEAFAAEARRTRR